MHVTQYLSIFKKNPYNRVTRYTTNMMCGKLTTKQFNSVQQQIDENYENVFLDIKLDIRAKNFEDKWITPGCKDKKCLWCEFVLDEYYDMFY